MNPPLNRRRFLSRSGLALLGLSGAALALENNNVPEAPEGLTAQSLVNDAAQHCIEDGVAYLARTQHDDGSFGDRQYRGNVAVTSLAALALMANGQQPGRGPHGKVILDALQFVMSKEDRSRPGFLNNPFASPHGPMYGHGFATVFLAEAHGMVHNKKLREELFEKLKRAKDLILRSQNVEGGWRYQPVPGDADLSVTVCQIMALRAAHNAGLTVGDDVWKRCIDYVKGCQNPDGGFRYLRQGGPSRPALAAAGVSALNSAGIYLQGRGDDPEQKANRRIIEDGLNYLSEEARHARAFGRTEIRGDMHYFYGHYYAVQAMWTAGEPRWSRWFPMIRDELVAQARTRGDGSWSDSVCVHYATAMALLILQISNNYLSIFQK